LGTCRKIVAKSFGPFEILDIIALVSYLLTIHASMNVYNVFNVSLLKKYVHDANQVIDWNLIQVEIEGDFQVQPMNILER
jgi:hypothetical protein